MTAFQLAILRIELEQARDDAAAYRRRHRSADWDQVTESDLVGAGYSAWSAYEDALRSFRRGTPGRG
jgi:hypothetical protein